MTALKRVLTIFMAVLLLAGTVPTVKAFADSTVTLTEQPTTDPDFVRIVKENNGKTITDGEAIFKVQYFANDSWSGSPARTWYYKTVDGEAWLGDKAHYLASCDYGISDPLYENTLGAPVIPLGTIRVTEAQAPEGYLRSDFTLDGKVTQPSTGARAEFAWTSQADNIIRYVEDAAYIHNDAIKGNLKLVKKDAFEEIFLSGAGYHILDENGEVVAEGYTGYNGDVEFPDLLYGNYWYQEFRPPMGFKLDDTKYPFSITENGVTIEKEATDLRREGTIQVKKQDATGKALSGATFLLEYSIDDGSHWKPVTYREAGDEVPRGGCTSQGLTDGQLTTGEDGKVVFTGLRADSNILYRLTETKAPAGMSLIGGSLYVGTLPIQSKDLLANDAEVFNDTAYVYSLYVTATDSALYRLPEAGGGGFALLPLAMTLSAVPLLFLPRKRKDGSHSIE